MVTAQKCEHREDQRTVYHSTLHKCEVHQHTVHTTQGHTTSAHTTSAHTKSALTTSAVLSGRGNRRKIISNCDRVTVQAVALARLMLLWWLTRCPRTLGSHGSDQASHAGRPGLQQLPPI